MPSPRPWAVVRTDAKGWKGISIEDANGFAIGYMVMQATDNEMVNAKLICEAVNALPMQTELISEIPSQEKT